MLGVTTSFSNNNWGIVDDIARYSIQVGYLAGKFGVGKVAAISQEITNRFLIILEITGLDVSNHWKIKPNQTMGNKAGNR